MPQFLAMDIAYKESDFYDLRIALNYNNQMYSGNFFSAEVSFSPVYFLGLRARAKLADNSLNTDIRMGFGLKIAKHYDRLFPYSGAKIGRYTQY